MRIRVQGKSFDVQKKDSGAGRQGRAAGPCADYKGSLNSRATCENCGWLCGMHPLTYKQFIRVFPYP